MLVLILDPALPGVQVAAKNLLAATTRPGERLVLLDERSGALIESSTVPQAGAVTIPAPPTAPQQPSTRFQQAHYQRAMTQYRATLSGIQAADRRQQQRLVAALGGAAFTAVFTAKGRSNGARPAVGEACLRASVSAAVGDVWLHKLAWSWGSRDVIAILGLGETAGSRAPRLRAGSLHGGTVIVSAFPSGSTTESAWQADLIQALARPGPYCSPRQLAVSLPTSCARAWTERSPTT